MINRTRIKHWLQNSLEPDLPAIVVASLGRSGSTIVYEAALDSMIDTRFPRMRGVGQLIVRDQSWILGERPLAGGCVYKTHDFPAALVGQENLRCVFLFGSTVDAALSVHSTLNRFGVEWVESHFQHLQATGSIEELFDHDVLGFQDQIQQWSTGTTPPTLCLRYETLWDHQQELSDFLELDVVLPKRRARTEKSVEPDILAGAEAIYGPIDRIVETLPNCFRASPEMDDHFAMSA